MSWTCPHQTGKDHCERLNRPCVPLGKGCVLHGRFKVVGQPDEKKERPEAPGTKKVESPSPARPPE